MSLGQKVEVSLATLVLFLTIVFTVWITVAPFIPWEHPREVSSLITTTRICPNGEICEIFEIEFAITFEGQVRCEVNKNLYESINLGDVLVIPGSLQGPECDRLELQ